MVLEWQTQCDPPEVPEGQTEARQTLIIKGFTCGEPRHYKGRRVERGTRSADTIADLVALLGFSASPQG